MKRPSLAFALSLLAALATAQPPVNNSNADALPAISLPAASVVVRDFATDEVLTATLAAAREAAAVARRQRDTIEKQLASATGERAGHLTLALGRLKEEAGSLDDAEALFASIVDGKVDAAPADIVAARMRLGYLDIARKDRPAALAHFAPIASGEIAADVATATDAGLRVAALHRLMGQWQAAEHAWLEVARQTPIAERARYARLQVCGLLVETAQGNYGPLPQGVEKDALFERAIDESIALYTDADVEPETKAIAESIEVWALAGRQDWRAVDKLAMPYVVRWSEYMAAHPFTEGDAWDPGRQIVTMQTWLLMAQYRLGEFDACIRTARMIRLGAWTRDVPYDNFNAFDYSYAYEALANEAKGDAESGKALRAEGAANNPTTFAQTLAHIERRLAIKS